ncbi:Phosphodiesterase [Pleurostoma richardsiae]|uniref:Phosphodiesterase n=1 Tax=Pleurostoma richardsiae TaxID=41990 RepID=A0AA38VNB0_9PEZI|nr:Phosphodiesterase [Pleurostoma richardsiae]
MDRSICNVIYVDRSAQQDRELRAPSQDIDQAEIDRASAGETWQRLDDDLRVLVDAFGHVQVCATGTSCISKILELHDASTIDHKPTIVLIDTPHDERIIDEEDLSRSPSPHSSPSREYDEGIDAAEEAVYGLRLLQRIITEAHVRNLSKLVVPIPIIKAPSLNSHVTDETGHASETLDDSMTVVVLETGRSSRPKLIQKCLDLGATEVLTSPLHHKNILPLEVIAYRAHKAAVKDRQALLEVRKGRKRSWVGVDCQKPYAYLREAMVSGLMNGICEPTVDVESETDGLTVSVSPDTHARIAEAVGKWHFSAHDFSEDELVIAASVMFNHALSMPELEPWRISADQLIRYLLACRAAYNSFVPYHNYRHVVDVLQATFSFLVSIGALAPYPARPDAGDAAPAKSPMAALLHPFEALTLLITAIGHDVGHPGVNNGFLITLNAPLAQLYNDRSVLEAFHCAAYSQILRRHWPAVFQDKKMRNLMISSILATDMGLHFDYMKKLGDIQEKLNINNTTEGWNGRMLEEQKALACCLLIKCADICNVAREHSTALRWMHILSDEFARQASMETELEIPSALMAPPLKDTLSMSRAQLNFMNLFAIPLFRGVVEILPAMQYCIDELEINKRLFERRVAEASAKDSPERTLPHPNDTVSSSVTTVSPAPSAEKERPAAQTVTSEMVVEASQADKLKQFSPKPADPASKPSRVPQLPKQYKEVNRAASSFDAVADFAASDPFNVGQNVAFGPGTQRRSDTTDASGSIPGAGDWASQATSATTSKMPLSPSTQGTSLVSRDSMDRPASKPGFTYAVPPDSAKSMSETRISPPLEDDTSSTGRHLEEKALKKKPSRFRMNAFPFFRKHKSPSPAAEPV